MSTALPSRFWRYHAVYPLLLFILLAFLFEMSDLDLVTSDLFFDFKNKIWIFRNCWWAESLIHVYGRKLVVFSAMGPLLVWLLSFFIRRFRPWRRPALYLILSISLGTGCVGLLKQTVNRHCPWDYDRYGGSVPYGKLFDPPPSSCQKGNCFPAGHASAGFSLMSGYFIYYGRKQRLANLFLLTGFVLGSLFGFAQVVRGAHFSSHNLWTIAVCWATALALYTTGFGRTVYPGAIVSFPVK